MLCDIRKIKFIVFLVIAFLHLPFGYGAPAASSCQNMSDDELLELLTETESRLECKASLSLGAACAGIAAGSGAGTVLAKRMLEKRQALQFSTLLESLSSKSTEIEALKYQQRTIAASGDLSLATNSSGDAKIKQRIAVIESEMKTLTEKIQAHFERHRGNPDFIKNITNEKNKNLLLMLEKNVANVQRLNPNGAKEYHRLVDQFITSVDGAKSGSTAKAASARAGSLRSAAAIGRGVLGSRLFQFLGGASLTGATLLLHSNNVACSSDTRLKYITYNDDCQPVIEVSQNVLDFLDSDPATQLSQLRTNRQACDFYRSLAVKIKKEDESSEAAISKTQYLTCGEEISFQIAHEKSVSSYVLKFDPAVVKSLRDYDRNEDLNFSNDGVLTQFCENKRCNYLQKGASVGAAEKILDRLDGVKYAASEAFKCCQDRQYNCPISFKSAPPLKNGPTWKSSTSR